MTAPTRNRTSQAEINNAVADLADVLGLSASRTVVDSGFRVLPDVVAICDDPSGGSMLAITNAEGVVKRLVGTSTPKQCLEGAQLAESIARLIKSS